jgi:serine protease
MRVTRLAPLFALFLFAAGAAQAQTAGVVTLQANQTSATGSLTPVLTWSTNPVAQSCTASGGWSGTKANYGTQTLSSISASTNYTLTCTWGNGSANVTWVAPTTNTDGSALANLAGFKVYYGTTSTSLTSSITVDDMTRRSATISPLAPGTWYVAVRAYNTSNAESANSNVATRVVTGATAAKTVAITINSNPTTPPPSSGSTEVEPNNTTSQAQVVSTSGITINGTMSGSTDYDYYRVSVPAGKKMTVSMSPNSSSDYELHTYKSDGTEAGYSLNGTGVTETLSVTNSSSSAKVFYARVKYYGGGTGSTRGKYTIRLSW